MNFLRKECAFCALFPTLTLKSCAIFLLVDFQFHLVPFFYNVCRYIAPAICLSVIKLVGGPLILKYKGLQSTTADFEKFVSILRNKTLEGLLKFSDSKYYFCLPWLSDSFYFYGFQCRRYDTYHRFCFMRSGFFSANCNLKMVHFSSLPRWMPKYEVQISPAPY